MVRCGMVGMVWQCNAMLCNIIYCMPYNSYNFDLPPAQYQQINDFPLTYPFKMVLSLLVGWLLLLLLVVIAKVAVVAKIC